MPFPTGGQQPQQQQQQAQQGYPPPPPQQQQQQQYAPPPPPRSQVPAVPVQIFCDGVARATTLDLVANMPPQTVAWCDGMESWGTLGQILAQHQGAPQQAQPPPQATGFNEPRQQVLPFAQHAGPPPQQQGYNPYTGGSAAQVGYVRNPYLGPGRYVLYVTASEYKVGRSNTGHILEGIVKVAAPLDPQDEPNAEGMEVSLYFKHNDSFLGNMKELALVGRGHNPHDPAQQSAITDSDMSAILNGPSPEILGALIYVEAKSITTKAGQPFTRYNFWPCAAVAGQADAKGHPIPDCDSIPR